MSGKIRVYELAKEAGVESKVLTAQLMEQGYDVKAYNSTLDEDVAEEIRQKLGVRETKVEEKRIEKKGRTTIIRRRRTAVVEEIQDEAPVLEAKEEPVEDAEKRPLKETEEKQEEEIAEETVKVEETVAVEETAEVETAAAPVGEPIIEAKEPVAPEVPPEQEIKEEAGEGIEAPAEAVSDEQPQEVKVEVKKVKKSAPVLKPKELPKRKKQISKIVGMTNIPLPVQEERPRPKRAERPKRPVAAVKTTTDKNAAADDGKGKAKGKKAKRFVKFSTEPEDVRGKKGAKRKGQVDIDAEELAKFSGRVGGGVRFGRGGRGVPRKKKKESTQQEASETKAIKKRIKVFRTISVGDFAHRMGVKANEVIAKLMGLGVMATLNQALDVDTATLVASDFGFEIEQGATDEQTILHLEETESGGNEMPRPPVVTVMGHVDHGKTSILDAIRNTDVAAGEAGGITQHIGAHYVRSPKGDLVFLDTPGHAAFTEMRSRGAQVTDVVVLVVAADDGVMDQTKEAINHARAAGVPILVAVNKIDKDDADPSRVQRELAELNLIPEDWGGDTIFCETSAKQGIGISELVENILLQTEILELKADPDRRAKGWVIEAQLHKGRGAVATVLVQHGTLRVGDHLVIGQFYGKVRSLTDDKGRTMKEAGPAIPVEVQGLSGVPRAGDEFMAVPDEKTAKTISQQRQLRNRESELAIGSKISLDNLFEKLQEGEMKELRVILRSDVQGTLEAFAKSIEELSTDEIKVKILHSGTGTIIESDILLAAASDALIIGFNVRPSAKVSDLAKTENVDLRFYDVIYHALDDIKKAMVGMLDPTFVEKVIGSAEVRQTFHVPKIGTIAGSYVTTGKIDRNGRIRLMRDGVIIYTGKISSLRRFKDDAREVQSGYECGIGIENYNDIKIGDQFEVFVMEEKAGVL
ncbi:MAG: translation initiation factor IF-2 [Desulfobulbaceae bacterium]|uniref:Translation initiation factor IF-2 n=1 Tax=Candidatus Desulfobia pelagia TaxID=2841692 RepID=A0A8J6TFV9_9BACT|nr:translation initiation factor IF-2 [Candidatus Desulfobia pelagia]